MPDKVIIERQGATQVITINREDARNAVDPETAAALKAGFEQGEADAAVKVHILTGAGGHFCAGADLKAVAGKAGFEREGPMGPSWMDLKKPSHCRGGRSCGCGRPRAGNPVRPAHRQSSGGLRCLLPTMGRAAD